jgi:hypothetical protein
LTAASGGAAAALLRHREERSDEAIQKTAQAKTGAPRFARHDGGEAAAIGGTPA